MGFSVTRLWVCFSFREVREFKIVGLEKMLEEEKSHKYLGIDEWSWNCHNKEHPIYLADDNPPDSLGRIDTLE